MKIAVKPTFFAYLLLICLFSSVQQSLAVFLALLVHEAGHWTVISMIKEPVRAVEFTPFGGMMTYDVGSSSSKGVKGVLLALAGPAFNYLMVLLISHTAIASVIGEAFASVLMMANLSMLLINILPSLPLDGGNALFSLGFYLFDVAALAAVLSFAGVACGVGFIGLGLYGMVRAETINVSLFMIGGYMVVCAIRSKEATLLENMYAVVQEQLASPKRIERACMYCVPADVQLYQLLKPIAGAYTAVFFVEAPDGRMIEVSSKRICRALLDAPCATLRESILQGRNEE